MVCIGVGSENFEARLEERLADPSSVRSLSFDLPPNPAKAAGGFRVHGKDCVGRIIGASIDCSSAVNTAWSPSCGMSSLFAEMGVSLELSRKTEVLIEYFCVP